MMYQHDEMGLFADEKDSVPYIVVNITAEEANIIEFKLAEFYSMNGKTLFAVRDKDGNETGDFRMFITFGPQRFILIEITAN